MSTTASVPDEVFDALAEGGGGPSATAHLRAAQYGKHLLLVRRVLDAAREARHPDAGRAEEAWWALIAAQEAAPEAVAATLRHPTVGVWARRTVLALEGHRREDPRVAVLASLAAAAALRAGTALRIEVPLDGPTAPLVSLGRAVVGGKGGAIAEVAGGRAVLSTRGGEVAVPDDPHRDGPGWQALRRMEAEHAGHRLALLLDDQEPDRMPGADLVPGRLSAREAEHWRATLREAWEILVEHHWTIARETADTVFTLTPTRARGGAHTSATARHAYGNLGLSTPPNPVALALTFAHEVQHAKLTALWDLAPLTLPDDGSRYYAPWRPDPRPAAGLFQGVYAHLGVAGFWRRHRHTVTGAEQERAHAQFAHWRRSTLDAARVLAGSGRLTPAGERFLPATTRTLLAWQDEPVPASAAEAADRAAREHLAHWTERNGNSSITGTFSHG
ncbi:MULTISPECIES: HEXXH motif domain-containing protein [Nocardiopsis]|uniref:HEXXH motif domain-containing protein n=1 Tax=Nocardiopsis changdeensis TaxID=2831969 RepID=A0ABX8BVU9_9ACTN|nr:MULTISPECIES: HEXXH motif domain-containing protein [Nocardiopsis]QUX24936.1 HEXXH motif domain-containing protein [Nocardiopsis changdeensis]QYX35322.1 HEXXH motif domain-containing protein [Nocardiopsis sp. MT53]